jgi:hypothetical protein
MIKFLVLASAICLPSIVLANDNEKYFELALAVTAVPEESLELMIDGLLENQIAADPSIKPIRRAFKTFYMETLNSDLVKNGSAHIQMELFTYEELLEINEMMQLPIYKKYMEVTPEYVSRTMMLGQQAAMANGARLKELIDAEHKHIEELQKLDEEMNLTDHQ